VVPTNYILALRFLVAGLGLLPVLLGVRLTRGLVWRGAVLGLFLYGAYALQTWGLLYTTASKNALITSVYVVLVPFFVWVLQRRAVGRRVLWAAGLAFAGLVILSPPEASGFNPGDLLTLLSGFGYAIHITLVGLFSEDDPVMPLTCIQFLFASGLAWAGALGFETFPASVGAGTWVALAYLAFGSTLVALTLMNLGIRHVTPARASILLATEALFGCLFGVLLQGDPFTLQIALGGTILTAAVVVSQTDPPPRWSLPLVSVSASAAPGSVRLSVAEVVAREAAHLELVTQGVAQPFQDLADDAGGVLAVGLLEQADLGIPGRHLLQKVVVDALGAGETGLGRGPMGAFLGSDALPGDVLAGHVASPPLQDLRAQLLGEITELGVVQGLRLPAAQLDKATVLLLGVDLGQDQAFCQGAPLLGQGSSPPKG